MIAACRFVFAQGKAWLFWWRRESDFLCRKYQYTLSDTCLSEYMLTYSRSDTCLSQYTLSYTQKGMCLSEFIYFFSRSDTCLSEYKFSYSMSKLACVLLGVCVCVLVHVGKSRCGCAALLHLIMEHTCKPTLGLCVMLEVTHSSMI